MVTRHVVTWDPCASKAPRVTDNSLIICSRVPAGRISPFASKKKGRERVSLIHTAQQRIERRKQTIELHYRHLRRLISKKGDLNSHGGGGLVWLDIFEAMLGRGRKRGKASFMAQFRRKHSLATVSSSGNIILSWGASFGGVTWSFISELIS